MRERCYIYQVSNEGHRIAYIEDDEEKWSIVAPFSASENAVQRMVDMANCGLGLCQADPQLEEMLDELRGVGR